VGMAAHGGRALVLERPASRSDASGREISGTTIYNDAIVRALLRYGTYDNYFQLRRDPFPARAEPAPGPPPAIQGLEILPIEALESLGRFEQVVLMTTAGLMTQLLPLRARPNARFWLASGVVHSMDAAGMPFLPLALLHSEADKADSLFCSSRAAKQVIDNFFADVAAEPPIACPIVPLGVDTASLPTRDRACARKKHNIAASAKVVLYCGRFSSTSKADLWILLHACADLAVDYPNLLMILAGDDRQYHLREMLTGAAQTLGCASHLMVYPDIPESMKWELLAAADVFVSPSDHIQETFGISLIEAMAAAVPVIASDWDGYRDIVVHGETGFLIPTRWMPLGDDIDLIAAHDYKRRNTVLARNTIIDRCALEARVRLLFDNPVLAQEMGRAGKARAAAHYDWSVVVPAYESVWRDASMAVRALRRGPRFPGAGGGRYRVQSVFRHYPSATVDQSAAAHVSPAGARFAVGGEELEWLIAPDNVTSLDLIRRLLRSIGTSPPRPLEEVISEMMRQTGLPRLFIATHIGIALKYGFLTTDDAQ
jgi:glycosyltransferase involved in cell wall biosynthesis